MKNKNIFDRVKEQIIYMRTPLSTRVKNLEENIRNNNSQLASLENIKLQLEHLEENVRHNNVQIENLQNSNNNDVTQAKIDAIKESIKEIKQGSNNSGATGAVANQVPNADATSEEKYYEIDYFDFENYFRGSEGVISERQKVYLPYFEGRHHVLDLGCGRGEFLQLLKQNQIDAIGVDFYDEFVMYDRNKGLNVISGDAVATLANWIDKVDGIFAGQLVEHLTLSQIIELCKNAYEKLEVGSYLIMETPNPLSLAIYTHAFYMDPSHQKPVHPLTLKYLTEKAGFKDVQILYTEESRLEESIPELDGGNIPNLKAFNQSMKKVSDLLYGSQDYAIIARR